MADTNPDGRTYRQADRQRRRQAGKTEIGTDGADGRTYRQADRQRRRQASRQTEKETDRQDRDRERWGRY